MLGERKSDLRAARDHYRKRVKKLEAKLWKLKQELAQLKEGTKQLPAVES